jgi:VanZ family protein
MKHRLLAYLAPIVWMTLIFVLSAQPALPGPKEYSVDFLLKKISHISVYGILYFLWYFSINLGKKKKNFLLPLIISVAYAFSDEIHQLFVIGRTPAIRDVGYDMLGMSVVILRLKKLI